MFRNFFIDMEIVRSFVWLSPFWIVINLLQYAESGNALELLYVGCNLLTMWIWWYGIRPRYHFLRRQPERATSKF